MRNFPQIHGHRGARGRRPENTLVSIIEAIEVGSDAAEVDLCVTADNQVIVHHDLALSPLIARDLSGHWIPEPVPVIALSATQLSEYDVGRLRPGTPYQALYPSQIPEDGARIPTLAGLIALITDSASDNFVLNLELKSDPTRPALTPEPGRYVSLVIDQIERAGIANRVFLQSFDWQLPRLVKARCPAILCGLLTDQQPDAEPPVPDRNGDGLWTDGFVPENFDGSVPAMVKAAGGDVWSCNFRDLTAELVRETHALGLEVYVWTVNEIKDMERMVAWEVDAITSDHPDRLVALRDGG